MKSRSGSFTSRQKQMVIVLCAILLLLPEAAPAQPSTESPVPIDSKVVGKPERVDLGGGRFKQIFRNKKGQIVREREAEIKGGTLVRAEAVLKTTDVLTVHPKTGKAAEVKVIHFNPDPIQNFPTETDEITYDAQGKPEKKITTNPIEANTRTVTTYPPGSGPEGVSRTEKKNPTTGQFEEVPTPTKPTTPATPPTTPSAPATPPSPAQPPPSDERTAEVMLVNYTPAEFYFGFSHNRMDGGDEREGFNGFATSIMGSVSRYVGLKGYYSFHTRSFEEDALGFSSRATIHQFLGGVQVQDNATDDGPVRLFVHFMAGVAHHRFSFDEGLGTFSDSKTGFGAAIGGGLDIRVNNRVDFRLIQLDYNPNRIEGQTQHNFRVGVGIVFR